MYTNFETENPVLFLAWSYSRWIMRIIKEVADK
jgi:hypothetical protein